MKATTEQEKTQQIRDFSAALQSKAFEEFEIPAAQVPSERLASLIQQYLCNLPHFSSGFSPEKQNLSIIRGWNLFYYVATASILTEVRHVARLETPYTGWEIPPKTKDESTVDAWAYAIAPPTLEEEVEHKSSIIGDSQSLHDCSRCTATGYIPCEKCGEKGKTRCRDCSGGGTFRCTTCAGTTTVTKTRTVAKEKKCDACGLNNLMNVVALFDDNPYTRARRCGKCGGSGVIRYKVSEPYSVACTTCRATGQERCKKCRATGHLTCGTCRGNTKLTCTKCKTHKKLVSYLSLERHFVRTSHSETIASSLFQKQFLIVKETCFVDTAKSVVSVVDANHIPESAIAKSEGATLASKAVAKGSVHSLKMARERSPSDGRIVEERLTLSRCSSIGFTYRCNKAQYRAICRPTPNTFDPPSAVLPHISPAAAWIRSRLAEAKALAANGDKRDAAVLFSQCRDLGAADPACLPLLSGDAADIPNDVVSLADKVTYTSGEVKFFAAALLILFMSIAISAAAGSFVPGVLAMPFCGVLAYIGWTIGRQTTGDRRGTSFFVRAEVPRQSSPFSDGTSFQLAESTFEPQDVITDDYTGFYSDACSVPGQKEGVHGESRFDLGEALPLPPTSRQVDPPVHYQGERRGGAMRATAIVLAGICSFIAGGLMFHRVDQAKYDLERAIVAGDVQGAGDAAVRARNADAYIFLSRSMMVGGLGIAGYGVYYGLRRSAA